MKRLLAAIVLLIFVGLACSQESTRFTPSGPPPTLAPVSPSNYSYRPPENLNVVLHDDFRAGHGTWAVYAQEPSQATLTTSEDALLLDAIIASEAPVGLVRPLGGLANPPDGVTLTLQAEGMDMYLLAGVKEQDGSWYHTAFKLHPAVGERTLTLAFSWLRLDSNSQDENDALDLDQVSEFNLVDLSAFTGPTGHHRLYIHQADFWTSETEVFPRTQCTPEDSPPSEFLVGVDANYIPEGETKHGAKWYVGEAQVDPLDLFAAQGVQALRLRMWVGEKGTSKQDYFTALAQRANSLGMQILPTLFLAEDWSDVNKQPVPSEWAKLSLDERAETIRAYAQETVAALLETGIQVPYYAVGNEIDYGIAGVFAEIDQRDPDTLRTTIWPQEARLVQAAIEGIRQVDPDALILLQIAQSFDPGFVQDFYTSMRNLGVEYDLAGLSFYPSAFGPLVVEDFCRSLDILADLGIPAIIPEFGYPAEVPSGGPFANWINDLPGYPLTPEGQAQWLADFLTSMRAHPNVIAAYYFSPAFHWGGEIWGPFALFDQDGLARPAIGAFSLP